MKKGYVEIRHICDIILTLQSRHGSMCGQRSVDVRLFVFYLSNVGTGYVR